MAKPQFSITLGRSGQRVVKDPWGGSDGISASASAPSLSKRSMPESFGGIGDHAFNNSKRMRNDMSGRSYGYSNPLDGNDSRLDPKDLRSKLTQKRISREMELEKHERKKMELYEKVSKAIRSVEPPNDNKLLRSTPSSREAAETPKRSTKYLSFCLFVMIDMAVLKQMGECDLKELGIPRGPRKRISLAVQERTKRPVTQPPSNYLLNS